MNALKQKQKPLSVLITGPRVGLAGYFKLEKYKTAANGDVIEESKEVCADWFPNLILNQGLDLLGSASTQLTIFCRTGSGSTTPANTQTALVSQIASSSTYQASSFGTNNTVSPYYGWRRVTYRFIAGVSTGNISEVGVGGGATTLLFSRALVLDGLGAPTTITVLSDEVLDVTYENRSYPDLTDHSGSFTLGTEGGSYDYTIRCCGISGSSNTTLDGGGAILANAVVNNSGVNNGVTGAETNVLLALTAARAGSTIATFGTMATYTNGNYYRDCSVLVDLNFGNFTTGLGRIIWDCNPLGTWQMVFPTTKIPKTNTKKFTIVTRFSWARA